MTYTSEPGQRDLRIHASHSLKANASASLNDWGLGLNRTTFGLRIGSVRSANTRAHSEGRKCRTTADSTNSSGVSVGTCMVEPSRFAREGCTKQTRPYKINIDQSRPNSGKAIGLSQCGGAA